ncbi:MAG TPA: glycosyl hydrolase [Candidatus Saccharimonadales bacterium]|nr:glycosyl hydrolase [Candidatus Saccharimonadales bacterium]
MKVKLFLIAALVLMAAASWLLLANKAKPPTATASTMFASPRLVNQTVLNTFPQKNGSSADTSHLSADIIPPTDSWLSGMVLQKNPQPVYPLPLSFQARNDGFEIGLPTIHSTATQISGEHTPGIIADLPSSTFKLSRFDKISATLTYYKNQSAIGSLTLAEGSPFIFYTALLPVSIALPSINPATLTTNSPNYMRFSSNGQDYALSTKKAKLQIIGGKVSAVLNSGDSITMYAVSSTNDPLKPYANNILSAVTTSHYLKGKSVYTSLDYKTTNGQPTAFSSLPYSRYTGSSLLSYQSIYGEMHTYAGNQFINQVPLLAPSSQLNLSKLNQTQKNSLLATLQTDTTGTAIKDTDSYFAGKELARAANLLQISEQLGDARSSAALIQDINSAFASRLSPKYFYYDSILKGMVADNTDFGSQNFNDHHFHYGYWLYAGGILAHYDKAFLNQYKDQLNLLAADIANYQNLKTFPETRYYDAYVQHSWADGLAPFADGNDEESSSEAIHAWNGVSLWGKLTNNPNLEQTGQWMLANEAYSAASIWRNVDTTDSSLAGYTSPIVGITFEGKRVYSTWFSDSPAAKLAIQLIPMDPTMVSFASDKNMMAKINAAFPNQNFNVSLGDYGLMYLSLSRPQLALSLASSQTNIDNGDSKTYMLAFIYSQLDH